MLKDYKDCFLPCVPIMQQKEFLQEIKDAVLAFDCKAQVILSGSRARGDNKPDSDWGILVLTERKADATFIRELMDSIYDLELTYLQAISLLIVERKVWENWAIMPLYKNIVREGLTV